MLLSVKSLINLLQQVGIKHIYSDSEGQPSLYPLGLIGPYNLAGPVGPADSDGSPSGFSGSLCPSWPYLKHKSIFSKCQLSSCFTVNVAFVPVDKANVTVSAEVKAISIISPADKLKITLPSNKLSTPSDNVLVLVADEIGTLFRRIDKVNATATDAVDTNFQLISYTPELAMVIALAATVVFNNGMVLLKATC